MTEKYYPIELLHWSGMSDEFLDKVKEILTLYPDYIHTLNSMNDNALIIACRVGNLEITKYRVGNLEITKYLVENTNVNIQHRTGEGNALTVAVQQGRAEIANYLVLNSNIEVERDALNEDILKILEIKKNYKNLQDTLENDKNSNANLINNKKIKNSSKI